MFIMGPVGSKRCGRNDLVFYLLQCNTQHDQGFGPEMPESGRFRFLSKGPTGYTAPKGDMFRSNY